MVKKIPISEINLNLKMRSGQYLRLNSLNEDFMINMIKKAIFTVLVPFFFVSCNSLPNGTPPEGPIISVTPGETMEKLPNDKDAVNYMITAISTACPPIAGAGSKNPAVSNEFTMFLPEINHMPMELWRSLINMKMICAVPPGDSDAKYKLKSEFKEAQEKGQFQWEVSLTSLPSGECVWKDSVIFKTSPHGKLP